MGGEHSGPPNSTQLPGKYLSQVGHGERRLPGQAEIKGGGAASLLGLSPAKERLGPSSRHEREKEGVAVPLLENR